MSVRWERASTIEVSVDSWSETVNGIIGTDTLGIKFAYAAADFTSVPSPDKPSPHNPTVVRAAVDCQRLRRDGRGRQGTRPMW